MANKSSYVCPHLAFSAWQPRYLQETAYNNLVAVICVNITSAVICMVLNALVVIVVVNKQQLRTVYNILLACLAVTDFLVGLLVQPLSVAADFKRIFGLIAMILLASINTESDLYSILLVAYALMFLVVIVVYIVTIAFSHTTVFLEAKKHKRRLQTEQLPGEEAKRLKKNHKAAKTLTIILTALFFSYLPVTVLLGSATFSDDLVEPHVLYILFAWCYTSVYVCSIFNPLIYCWRMKKLRGALFDILHLRRAQISTGME